MVGAFLGFRIPLADSLVRTGRTLRIAWYSLRYRNKLIRISASYLFRIPIGAGYLLIRNDRWHYLQPVGGVYKYTEGALEGMSALNDALVPVDALSTGDLRIRIPGKHLRRFARWFESGRRREFGPWREFHEELVETGLLPREDFPYVDHHYLGRQYRPIRFSTWENSLELLIADVFELCPTERQGLALTELAHSNTDKIYVASEAEIRHRGVSPGTPRKIEIAETAMWTIEA